ncbi:MAG TPA: lipid-A-disaccharide synthase [Chroococcales cyanobacterium]
MSLIFLAAGEVSGDRHGACLAREILALEPESRLVGWGGEEMQKSGVEILSDLTPLSAVGLLEQLPGLPASLRALGEARKFLKDHKPDVVVLIDYQGANMKLARFARLLKIPTVYYIAPQEWIWGFKNGARRVAASVDVILAIFEQEAKIYREVGGCVGFVGHPLLDQVPNGSQRARIGRELGLDLKEPILGLLPGSRKNEVKSLLPIMLKAAEKLKEEFPTIQPVIPVASAFLASLIEEAISNFPFKVWTTETSGMGLIQSCDVAIAASGTATLEAAIVGTPVVAAYKISPLTEFVARRLMRSPFVTLPNILTGRKIVPELLQGEANPLRMAQEAAALLGDPRLRQEMLREFSNLRAQLGRPGAAQRAAKIVLETRKK